MKKIIIKITSIVLALLVLFSTLSFTVAKHYCGDFLVDVSFTGEAEACGMEMSNVSEAKMKSCCKDEVHKVEGQDELQFQKIDNFSFEKQQFLAAYFLSFKKLLVKNASKNIFYKDFSPPDIPTDYQVLYQVFLI
ncbi:hypothetical protein BW723_02380 [Polaribacter reichenbachii]|uniref:Secreted protein n=1 Tax=Polaribacter reichenbachii TaxID=996801 RepID=A0A1B8TW04_9FLAO|nr:hypothetical protein [Polaribacter reichenbachii]APZ45212.1 hypothetical protein BW723_02380 [Polaribacter reichenbachii]AUC19075.1 hypothetical protein BTO17_10385 [Polaribacter reichenbachii]OBY63770.1 hypothetical protein LPB301_13320 [Polaribacter reichenbachii]